MQPTFSEIKSAGRSALRHRWPEAIAVSLIYMTTVLLNGIVQRLLMTVFKLTAIWSPFSATDISTVDKTASVGIALFSAALSLCLSYPLFFGTLRWFWLVSGGSDPSVGEIFHYFSSWRLFGSAVLLSLAVYILISVGALLLMAPSMIADKFTSPEFYASIGRKMPLFMESLHPIVVVLRALGFILLSVWSSGFLLSFAVLFSEPQLSVFAVIKRSLKITKGLKFNFVVFMFSFFGWILASLLIIPLVIAIPYFLSSLTVYGRELCRASRNRNAEAAFD